MNQRPDVYHERAACPLYTAIAVIDGRWKPMIYQRISSGALGLRALERSLPRIRRKVLVEQLRQMQADGLIHRRPLAPARLGVRYRLTPYGRTLGPVFESLWCWGRRHLARKDAARGTSVRAPG